MCTPRLVRFFFSRGLGNNCLSGEFGYKVYGGFGTILEAPFSIRKGRAGLLSHNRRVSNNSP